MKYHRTKKRARSQDRELAELCKQANAEHRAAQKALHGGITAGIKKSVPRMMNCGDYLLKAKKRLGHGRYLPWLAGTDIPERTAQRYCWMAKHRSEIEAKSATVADLTYRRVIELLTPTATIGEIDRDAERTSIRYTPTTKPSSSQHVMNILPPAEEPTGQSVLTGGGLHRADAEAFAQDLATFARSNAGRKPDVIATELPAEMRETAIKDADAITTFLNEVKHALWETGKPKLVS